MVLPLVGNDRALIAPWPSASLKMLNVIPLASQMEPPVIELAALNLLAILLLLVCTRTISSAISTSATANEPLVVAVSNRNAFGRKHLLV